MNLIRVFIKFDVTAYLVTLSATSYFCNGKLRQVVNFSMFNSFINLGRARMHERYRERRPATMKDTCSSCCHGSQRLIKFLLTWLLWSLLGCGVIGSVPLLQKKISKFNILSPILLLQFPQRAQRWNAFAHGNLQNEQSHGGIAQYDEQLN